MLTQVTALLSVPFPDGYGDATRARHDQLVAELLGPSFVLPFLPEDGEKTRITFSRYNPTDFEEGQALLARERSYQEYVRIRATAAFNIDAEGIIDRCGVFRPEEADLVARYVAAQEMERAIGELALAANVAQPGSLDIEGGQLVFDGRFEQRRLRAYTNQLGFATDEVASIGWPKLQHLAVGAVWRWMGRLEGFDKGLPKGRGGRALAAFSQLIKGGIAENSPIDLIWILVGLEALYGHGNVGLKAQLIEKSQMLLGRPTAFRKRFDGMYDYRSRFVHGDLDIPLSHWLYRGGTETNKFELETYETWTVAAAVLVASLQELVLRGWSEPAFGYVVSGVPIDAV